MPDDDYHAEPYEDEPVVALVKRRDIDRNDPCPCNSGKKYKYCHIKADKLLLPQEMHHLLQILVTVVNGITIPQKTFDEFEEIGVNISYDEKNMKWNIWPVGQSKPNLIVPSQRPVVPTRKLIKLS